MSPRRTSVEHSKGVFEVEWPLFGELSRGLALKVARAYDPEIVIGIATAGVVPGAVIAAILGREFYSLIVSRRCASTLSGFEVASQIARIWSAVRSAGAYSTSAPARS